jgi:hypothetical protein
MPLPEAVHIPFFAEHINEDGIFEGPEVQEEAAHIMLKELARWTECLKQMR